MNFAMTTKKTTQWIRNNFKTNPIPKIVSGLGFGAILIIGATMLFGSTHVESIVGFSNVGSDAQSAVSQPSNTVLYEQSPYFEDRLRYRDQRHLWRLAEAEAKESTIVMNGLMSYFEDRLQYRDQR